MLKGRLGLETARIPQKDRHGLIWLSRGQLFVEDGTLRFKTAGSEDLRPGDYAIPFQMLNAIMLGPGSTVSHDAMRLLARHGTGLLAVGESGVRFYASMPFGPDRSGRARKQATAWADANERVRISRRMYSWRLGEVLPTTDIAALRGIEGARVKQMYKRLADQYGISWRGRRYDRVNPGATDPANEAINHAASAVYAAAEVATAITGAIPQLGFIHEESGRAFSLDIADLFRDDFTVPVAFAAVRGGAEGGSEVGGEESLERAVRRLAGQAIRKKQVIPKMIDRIKGLFD